MVSRPSIESTRCPSLMLDSTKKWIECVRSSGIVQSSREPRGRANLAKAELKAELKAGLKAGTESRTEPSRT